MGWKTTCPKLKFPLGIRPFYFENMSNRANVYMLPKKYVFRQSCGGNAPRSQSWRASTPLPPPLFLRLSYVITYLHVFQER